MPPERLGVGPQPDPPQDVHTRLRLVSGQTSDSCHVMVEEEPRQMVLIRPRGRRACREQAGHVVGLRRQPGHPLCVTASTAVPDPHIEKDWMMRSLTNRTGSPRRDRRLARLAALHVESARSSPQHRSMVSRSGHSSS